MSGLWRRLWSRFQWNYVGTVVGRSHFVDDEGNKRPGGRCDVYWVLTERIDGKRACKKVGTCGGSALSVNARARVSAWLRGGPLPPLEDDFKSTSGAKVMVLPGGKGEPA